MSIERSRWRVTLAGLSVFAAAACGMGAPPSDAAMIAHFHAKRAAFDGIVRMMAEDGIEGTLEIDPRLRESAEETARREHYRALLEETGCRSIVRNAAGLVECDVWYLSSGGGLGGTGFKSYVYARVPPKPLLPTLDRDDGPRFQNRFRHVDGAWYLCRMPV